MANCKKAVSFHSPIPSSGHFKYTLEEKIGKSITTASPSFFPRKKILTLILLLSDFIKIGVTTVVYILEANTSFVGAFSKSSF